MGKKRETLEKERQNAIISRQLVCINTQVPTPQEEEFYRLGAPQINELKEFYQTMNFSSLFKELESGSSQQPEKAIEIPTEYILVDTVEQLDELMTYLSTQKEICFDTETTSEKPLRAELVGIGFGVEPGKAWYVPVNGKLGLQAVLQKVKPLLKTVNRILWP